MRNNNFVFGDPGKVCFPGTKNNQSPGQSRENIGHFKNRTMITIRTGQHLDNHICALPLFAEAL